jgi:kynureninase
MPMNISRLDGLAREAAQLDAMDALADFSELFHHPTDSAGQKRIYLAGHSLGLAPKSAAAWVQQELTDWQHLGVLGHHEAHHPWIDYHELATQQLAALTGAMPSEVVAMNSLSVNLHLMMTSFFRPMAERNCLLIEAGAFPSDRYAVASQLRWHGLNEETHLIEIEPLAGTRCLGSQVWIETIERAGSKLALVLLPGVQYLSGEWLDLPLIIAAARRAGAMVGIDLAHAIGNMPLQLHDWGADFAVWCSYKYLNAGPGAIGGCFVHERHTQFNGPRLLGWWGHNSATRFAMRPAFDAQPGAAGWQLSNPPIFSMAPLLASLEIFSRAGMTRLRAKSVALTGFFERIVRELLGGEIAIVTPSDAPRRGCQLSLRIQRTPAAAKQCIARLDAAGLVGDWREPDILRLAPTPLYNSFAEVVAAARVLGQALAP